MTKEEKKDRQHQWHIQERIRKYGGNPPPIESKSVVKLFGLRVIIGTFDKHNPTTIYYSGTINCEGGTYDGEQLRKVGLELKKVFDSWIKSQTVYETYYIRLVDVQDDYNKERNWNYIKYVPKNKHLKFELTVKHKKQLPWKEVVEVAKNQVMLLYPEIKNVIDGNSMKLKDFKGHNLKSGVAETAEPETC